MQVDPDRTVQVARAHAYDTSVKLAGHKPRWLRCYNWRQPHASIKAQTPIDRTGLNGDNLLRFLNRRLRGTAR